MKTTGNFKFGPSTCANKIQFPIEQDAVEENWNIISTTYRDVHRHKIK